MHILQGPEKGLGAHNRRQFMIENTETISGSDYKRMVIGAYSEFLLEYENINSIKKTGKFFYCG